MSNYDTQIEAISCAADLQGLRDALNDLEGTLCEERVRAVDPGRNVPKLEEVVNIDDLKYFSTAPDSFDNVWSWDDTHVLTCSPGSSWAPWYIEPRAHATTAQNITPTQIQALLKETRAAGDDEQRRICQKALHGDKAAIETCASVIAEAERA